MITLSLRKIAEEPLKFNLQRALASLIDIAASGYGGELSSDAARVNLLEELAAPLSREEKRQLLDAVIAHAVDDYGWSREDLKYLAELLAPNEKVKIPRMPSSDTFSVL